MPKWKSAPASGGEALPGDPAQWLMRMFDTERPGVVIEVSEPRSPFGRMRGLIGSPGLEPAHGLLLRTRQVHTFGMSFPIDALYLSPQGWVLKIRTLPPNRMGPVIFSARWVLEMAAGEAERLGIREGSHLSRDEFS